MLVQVRELFICACVLYIQIDQLGEAVCTNTMQTCLNCRRSATYCPVVLGSKVGVINGSNCKEECYQLSSCDQALYSGKYQECNLFDCISNDGITLSYEGIIYRRACHSDCPVFEIEVLPLTQINSSCVLQTHTTSNYHDCFALCMDLVGCRAVSYYSNFCYLHDCTSTQTPVNLGFFSVIKVCKDPPPPVVQTCINCIPGTKCTQPMYTDISVTSYDACSVTCTSDNDCGMLVYKRDKEQCGYHFCNQVSYDTTNASVSFRRTHNTDCPNYELIRIMNTMGKTAAMIAYYSDGMDDLLCLERCLETVGCVAIGFLSPHCLLFNGYDVKSETSAVYYQRICIDDCVAISQTCLNCDRSSICQNSYSAISVPITSQCEDACVADDRCKTAVFQPSTNQCNFYQCPRMSYSHFDSDFNLNTYSTNTVFRKSCTQGCPVYRLQYKVLSNGTCPAIDEDYGDVNLDYCVHKCLDMENCRAVTYSSDPGGVPCIYHSCDDHEINAVLTSHTFIWRECEEALNTTIQTCVNCAIGTGCQSYFYETAGVSNSYNCNRMCANNDSCSIGVFNSENGTCSLSECSKVDYNAYSKTFRRSKSTGCPVYSIHKRYNYTAVSISETFTQIWTSEECLAICLDHDNCSSAVYLIDLQVCFHQRTTVGTYSANLNSIFFERDCNAGCERTYTQTCHRCEQASHCPAQLRQINGVNLIADCYQSPYWSTATSVHYSPTTNSCTYYDCSGVQNSYTAASERLVRKSCINECPDFGVETLQNTRGDCDYVLGKASDLETERSFCLEHCLDTSTCRGVNFNTVTKTCYYLTNTCDADTPTINDPDWTYTKIDCFDQIGNDTQTCSNCAVSECQSHFDEMTVTSSSECRTACETSADCLTSHFDQSGGKCLLYQSSTITQGSHGSTLFRKSNNADCRKYELYMTTSYIGNCAVMAMLEMIRFYQHCMEICLDTPGCRAITHVETSELCYLYNTTCNDLLVNPSALYVIKDCQEDCIPPYTQTCVNCKPSDSCHSTNYVSPQNVTKPLNIDTSPLQLDEDVKQIWYNASLTQYQHLSCPYVSRCDGDYSIVYRKTCSSDCTKFELFHLFGYRGTCSEISALSGNVTQDTCFSKCLDMVQCRGVTVDILADGFTRCIFHDCDDYVNATGYEFMRRRCIEECGEPIIQECVGCLQSDKCHHYDLKDIVNLVSDCADIVTSETTMMSYSRSARECKVLQCPFVRHDLFQVVHRNSCNPDCVKYEIFDSLNLVGVCDVIEVDRGDAISFEQCVARCLDMPNCRAMTYHPRDSYCEYHNCSAYVSSTVDESRFLSKRCLDNDPPRSNVQTCVGCGRSYYCQNYASYQVGVTEQQCRAIFDADTDNYSRDFDMDLRFCGKIDCHLVMQDSRSMHDVKFRRSTSNDCPIYRLLTFTNKTGSCFTLDHDVSVNVHYCVNRCLDMDNCRAITFLYDSCVYHNCTDYNNTTDPTTFVIRKCMTQSEYDPVKAYTQVILDGRSDCGESWDTNKVFPVKSTQNSITKARDCDTSCADCNLIVYSPSEDMCRQYECDKPAPNGEGNTLFRKTANPDCLHVYLTVLESSVPVCTPYQTDEGFTPSAYCIELCLDDPECKALGLNFNENICTRYNCTTSFVPDNSTRYLVIKNCIDGCVSPTMQTCLNCKEGTLCQTAYKNSNESESDCLVDCDSDTDCVGLLYNYNSSVCSMFQCGRVEQQYNSTVYRKTCDSDCPVYEMYVAQGFGTCDVFESMTEQLVANPEVCYQRCLDTFGCRGVTYAEKKCEYHLCDCYTPSTNNKTFMWRYCLNDVAEKTNLTDPMDSESFPVKCINESTTTIPSTTTTPSTTTSATSTIIKPIFILPCLCYSGPYRNLTEEEILADIESTLIIDVESTSNYHRKHSSASDERTSAVTIGSVGVAVLASVSCVILVIDIPVLIRAFHGNLKPPDKTQPKKSGPSVAKDNDKQKASKRNDHSTFN